MKISQRSRERVALLIARLASKHDGEVVASARALGRVLKSEGLSLSDLVDEVRNGEVVGKLALLSEPCPRRCLDALMAMLDELNPRERRFVANINKLLADGVISEPSEKQRGWIFGMYERKVRHAA